MTHSKAWVEMIPRYPATGVGVLIQVLAVMGWKAWAGRGRKTHHHPINPWWPPMNFQQGFGLWRELGLTGAGEPLSFAALTAINYVHRLMAFPVLAVLAWQLNRVVALRSALRWIAALTGLQMATGLGNVVLNWPLLADVLQTGGVGALVVVMTWAVTASRTRSPTLASISPEISVARGPA